MAKKMGDVYIDIALVAAIGLGAYWLYSKFLGPSVKDQSQAANNKTTDANTAAANAAAQSSAVPAGQKTTIDPSTLNSMANTIITEINADDITALPDGNLGSNLLQIAIQVNNTADWYALVTQFGTRKLNDGTSVDLVTALKRAMTIDQISDLDSFLSEQSINVII